jgi:hypothetical protein
VSWVRGRPLAATLVASVVWLTGAGAARGDLGLVFARPVAHPGAVIDAVTADRNGRPEVIPAIRGIRVYLVPMTAARSPRHQRPTGLPDDPRWIPLGPLVHRQAGVIHFRFTVPDVRPGDYTLGFWCRKCAPPRGTTFTGAYPGTEWKDSAFSKVVRVVSPAAPAAERRSRTGTPTPLVAAFAALVAAVMIATVALRKG